MLHRFLDKVLEDLLFLQFVLHTVGLAVFVMFTLFAFFGLADDAPHNWSVAPIILSVSLGSVTYWFSMSWLLSRFRSNFRMRTIVWISRITGALIVIIGIALLGQGLFNVIFQGMPII